MVVTQLEVIGSLKLFEERSLKIKMQIVININIIRKWEQAHKEKTQINLIQRKKGITIFEVVNLERSAEDCTSHNR